MMFRMSVYWTISMLAIIAVAQNSTDSKPPTTNRPTNPAGLAFDDTYLQCPGTEKWNDCLYPSTRDILTGKKWECKAGFFCLSAEHSEQCSPGFFCPQNSREPIYCPERYFCSKDATEIARCPKGHYCPKSTVNPFKCYISVCGEGVDDVFQPYFLFVASLVLLTLYILLKAYRTMHTVKMVKMQQTLMESCLKPEYLTLIFNTKSQQQIIRHKSFHLVVKNLSLKFHGGLDILKDVNFEVKPGQMCAVIGSSGCGKNELIPILMGWKFPSAGNIFINGENGTLGDYTGYVGCVPKKDTLAKHLTTKELLYHYAKIRLPSEYSEVDVEERVSQIMSFLGLESIMNCMVEEGKFGLTISQKKRISIACELLAAPSLLLMDDMTEGLDTPEALEITRMIRLITEIQDLTTLAVVSNPTKEIFDKFSDVILLGKKGEVYFNGQLSESIDYFGLLGFPEPEDSNLYEHLLQISTGKVRSKTNDLRPADLANCWQRYTQGLPPLSISDERRIDFLTEVTSMNNLHQDPNQSNDNDNAEGEGSDTNADAETTDEDVQEFTDVVDPEEEAAARKKATSYKSILLDYRTKISQWFGSVRSGSKNHFRWLLGLKQERKRRGPGVISMFLLLLYRAMKQKIAAPEKLMMNTLLHFTIGVGISLITHDLDFLARLPDSVCSIAPKELERQCVKNFDNIQNAAMFISWGILFAGMTSSYATFGDELLVFRRERTFGTSPGCYYLSKVLTDFTQAVFAALVFSTAFVMFFTSRVPFLFLYILFVLLYMYAFALGHFVSVVTTRKMTTIAGTVISLLVAVIFGGVIPPLDKVQKDLPFARFLWDLSGPRWFIEGFWLQEVLSRSYLLKNIYVPPAYNINELAKASWMLIILTLASCLATFITLRIIHRKP